MPRTHAQVVKASLRPKTPKKPKPSPDFDPNQHPERVTQVGLVQEELPTTLYSKTRSPKANRKEISCPIGMTKDKKMVSSLRTFIRLSK